VIQKHIGRLDVAVNDSALVRKLNCQSDIADQSGRDPRGQRAWGKSLG
jgi:hypothetical protein